MARADRLGVLRQRQCETAEQGAQRFERRRREREPVVFGATRWASDRTARARSEWFRAAAPWRPARVNSTADRDWTVRGVVAHSGGPTPVINASLLGVVEQARLAGFSTLYGARHGVEGLLAGRFVDLFAQSDATMAAVAEAPGSALGTSRRAVSATDVEQVLAVCRDHDISCLFYTGGNGSMGTALEIERHSQAAGLDLHVVGIPKTIDNDLAGTDHAPGYPSAARFFACAARDLGADNRALPGLVQVLEVLGRNSGWIAAATGLVRRDRDDAPHLIYLPERPLPLARLLNDVQNVFDRLGRCLVVVCEGQLDQDGRPFGADVRISSRGPLATNLAHRLALLITEHLGLKARGEKPGLVGRSSVALRSQVDWNEARACGHAAVRAARDGATGVMIGLTRSPEPDYASTTTLVPLESVAYVERRFPGHWMHEQGGAVAPAFAAYAIPLMGPIDRYPELEPSNP